MISKQTGTERDIAHMRSTEELLTEIMEAQKIPLDIFIAACWAMCVTQIWINAESTDDFVRQASATLDKFDKYVPIFMLKELNNFRKTADTAKFIELATRMMKRQDVKLENGKIKL